jgi:hypothetical protein
MSITNTSQNRNAFSFFGFNTNEIYAQETRGQQELVESSQLPSKGNYGVDARTQYEKMGIKVIGKSKNDDLFFDVELPQGWVLNETCHSMHSELLDEHGRKRAGIFYKAAFYDRTADITFHNRIRYKVDRLGFFEGDYSYTDGDYASYRTPFVGRVLDFDDTVLFETGQANCDVEYVPYRSGRAYSDAYKEKSRQIESDMERQCMEFLTENYPDYEDVNAYWGVTIPVSLSDGQIK